jgi:hypothetical protein
VVKSVAVVVGAERAVCPVVDAVEGSAPVQESDEEVVARVLADRISSDTRDGYGDQLPRWKSFLMLRRGWRSDEVESSAVWLQGTGPPPRSEVWSRQSRQTELIICVDWLRSHENLGPNQVKRFCKGFGDVLRLRQLDDFADLLQAPAVMVARKQGFRESARIDAIKRDENATKLLEGHLVLAYARGRWTQGVHSTDMRLADKAVGSLILLAIVQFSLRIGSLCRTKSVKKQMQPRATRCRAPNGAVALDKHILWCTDVSLGVRGVVPGDSGAVVVWTALALSVWWRANFAAVVHLDWMGVAFRTTKSNADGKRANKFRVDRDCAENEAFLDRILLWVGWAGYEVDHDPFFSRPVPEQIGFTLSRARGAMVDDWSAEKRADHEHEGRTRHVYTAAFATLLAKEVATANGLSDVNVSSKSLKVLAITTLEEARAEQGMSLTQVAAYCDHKSLAGNAAYKVLSDRKSTLSLVAVSGRRSTSWGVAAVPAPAESSNPKTGSHKNGRGVKRAATTVIESNRVGKRQVTFPARLRQ